jgi:hypothetical protein
LVFVTKYRHPVFTDAHLSRLEDIFQAVCADFGCDLVECNGEAEHVHLLVTYPPTVQLSWLVNSLKGVSSRRLRQEFPELARALLAAQTAVVPLLLHRQRRRCPAERPTGLHRAAAPTPRPQFTSGLKTGAPPEDR